MTQPQQLQKSAIPEIPPEVMNRPAVALTELAAEDGTARPRDGLTDRGQSGTPGQLPPGLAAYNAQKKASRKSLTARESAEKLFATEPMKGMKASEIEEVRGRSYKGSPKMDDTLGDRTPAFVNWLFKSHPTDAAIRYCYRDIWPTE